MRRSPPFVDPESSLRATAQTLADQGAGAAVVLGPKGPASIVTERDVVAALADHADPDKTWAVDVASDCLVSVAPGASVADAVREMAALHIRHLPVRAGGEIVGVVAAEDVLHLLASKLFGNAAEGR